MRSTRTTLIGFVILALVVGACAARPGDPANPLAGASSAAPVKGATGSSEPTTAPGAGAAASALPAASPDAWLAVGRRGAGGLEVILASTREKVFDLPTGAPNSTWGRLITAEVQGGKTVVRDLVVQPGFGGDSTTVDGAWRLPTIGPDPVPVGVSDDGSTIVLVAASKGGPTTGSRSCTTGSPSRPRSSSCTGASITTRCRPLVRRSM